MISQTLSVPHAEAIGRIAKAKLLAKEKRLGENRVFDYRQLVEELLQGTLQFHNWIGDSWAVIF